MSTVVNGNEVAYVLIYESEWCFDDGGMGHDYGWRTHRMNLTAKTDRAAKTEAKQFIDSPKHPCGSCGNHGGRRLVDIVREESRSVALLKGRR